MGVVNDSTAGTTSTGRLLRQASAEILKEIERQCIKDPVSMGEFINPPNAESGTLLKSKESDTSSTVAGSVFTLTNTILGSGTLAVPYAISCSGYALGLTVMTVIALITRYSVNLLLRASDFAGDSCAKTYESLGYYTMGRVGTFVAEFTFIFGGFGTLISYFLFISNLLCAVFNISVAHNWIVSCVVTVLVVMPLSLSRRVGKLRLTSVLATVAVAYVVLFTVVAAAGNTNPHRESFRAVDFKSDSVYTVTLLVAAFACHNTTLPVYEELKNPSIKRMNRAVGYAIAIAYTLYTLIGIAGYATFGSDTMDNILLNFKAPSSSSNLQTPLVIGRLAMGLALLLTCPIAIWPFRSCVCSVYLRLRYKQQLPSSATSTLEYVSITIITEALILGCSIVVPSVKVPLSIVGSVSGSLIIFILPSLFYLILSPYPVISRRNVGPILLLTSGVLLFVLGLCTTLYKLL